MPKSKLGIIMRELNIIFGITNIACGVLFVLISVPLVTKKVPMNKLYGFRLSKAFTSQENWYKINRYGGKQLIQWSVLLFIIGILYFIFPIREAPHETFNTVLAVAPIVICTTIPILKTVLYAREM
jgi:hypothetical protein